MPGKLDIPRFCRESKGQSSAMPACTLAFASLCLQNALMLLKSAEFSTVHESDSALLENQVAREDDSVNQELDASRYHLTLFITSLLSAR